MSFLDSYFKYASHITDSPTEFHDFISIATAGVAIGRKRYVQLGHQKIYPNFYMIILAPSSMYRKSTALSISRMALTDVNPLLVYHSDFSQEKMSEILKEQPVGAFYWFEWKTLIGLLSKDYMAGTKAWLTELFDCYSMGIARKGISYTIDNPCVSILSATTSDWFTESVQKGDIHGGFLARFLFVHSKNKTRNDSMPPEPDQSQKAIMDSELLTLSRLEDHQMRFSPEARKVYDVWYNLFVSNFERIPASFRTMFARMPIYALKIAIVVEVCNNTSSVTISADSLNKALQYCKWLEKSTSELMHRDLSFSRHEAQEKKVLSFLREKNDKKADRASILQYCNLSGKEAESIISTLLEKESIETSYERKEGSQKKSQFLTLLGQKR